MTDSDDTMGFDFARQRLAVIDAKFLQKTGVVPVTNRSQALFMLDIRTGEQYVVKRDIGTTDIVAEAVGWLLSRELGVRTPDACFVTGQRCGWASRLVEPALNWDPEEASLCNPIDIANIFVLDAIIGNTDRHDDNVLVTDEGGDAPLLVHSIDLGNSRIGHAEGFAELGLDVPEDPQFLRGLERINIERHASSILERAILLSTDDSRIINLFYQAGLATGLIAADQRGLFAKQLKNRLQNAENLLFTHLDVTLSGGVQ